MTQPANRVEVERNDLLEDPVQRKFGGVEKRAAEANDGLSVAVLHSRAV
jgi:hypothetical protein